MKEKNGEKIKEKNVIFLKKFDEIFRYFHSKSLEKNRQSNPVLKQGEREGKREKIEEIPW